MNYGEYLRSDHWRDVKRHWVESGRATHCVVCGDPDYQLHHKTYDRLYREELDDLEPLCERHHRERHGLPAEGAWKAFTRTQRDYRKTFVGSFGLLASHYCYFCDGKLDGHVRPYNSTATVVHHQDENRANNHPLNLKPAHLGCHTRYHSKRTVYGEDFREKMSEIVQRQWDKMDPEIRERRATQARRALQRPWKKSREEVLASRGNGIRRAYADPEKRRAMSERAKGEKNPFYGRRHDEKTREKMREGQRNAPRASCVRCRRTFAICNLERHLKACRR